MDGWMDRWVDIPTKEMRDTDTDMDKYSGSSSCGSDDPHDETGTTTYGWMDG